VFNPLCAFLGGFVAQECIKAITQKFSPANQLFYYDAVEVLPDFDVENSIKGTQTTAQADTQVNENAKEQEVEHNADESNLDESALLEM